MKALDEERRRCPNCSEAVHCSEADGSSNNLHPNTSDSAELPIEEQVCPQGGKHRYVLNSMVPGANVLCNLSCAYNLGLDKRAVLGRAAPRIAAEHVAALSRANVTTQNVDAICESERAGSLCTLWCAILPLGTSDATTPCQLPNRKLCETTMAMARR